MTPTSSPLRPTLCLLAGTAGTEKQRGVVVVCLFLFLQHKIDSFKAKQQLVSEGGSRGGELFILLFICFHFVVLAEPLGLPVLLKWSCGGRAAGIGRHNCAVSGRKRETATGTAVAGFTAERTLPVIFPHVLNAVLMWQMLVFMSWAYTSPPLTSKNKSRFSPVAWRGTGLNNQACCLIENLERAETKFCPYAEWKNPATVS